MNLHQLARRLLQLMYVAEPVLAAAGERIAKQLPVARGTEEGMVWEEMGRGEDDDEFLVDWKTQVCVS